MPFNGAGVYQRIYDWITDRDNNVRIRADRTDEEMYGFADALSNTICRDGQSTISDHIPWNGKRITNLGAATQDTDALSRLTGDGRYLRTPKDLTPETAFADGDIFGFYDLSALADRGGTYASLKTALTTDFRADGRMVPIGTRQPFQQTTPPAGYTKETDAAYNDAVSYFTTGTVNTGGTQAASTTFTATRTPTGSVSDRTLINSMIPSHAHVDTKKCVNGIGGGSGTHFLVDSDSSVAGKHDQETPTTTSSTGGGNAHDHGLVMNAMNFDVKFVRQSIGIKT